MTSELSGRVAIVTGASRGLGLAIASRFAWAGADLVICARDAERLEAAADVISSHRHHESQRVVFVPADVSREEDVDHIVKLAFAEFASVHILVNNAGVYGPMGLFEDIPWDEWKRTFDINVHAPALMCRKLLPHFRKNRYGKIIQISGGGATTPLPRLEAYAATKSAVVRFAESLAMDCAGDHIDVNSVAPGLLDTRMLDQVLEAGPQAVGESYYARMVMAKHEKKSTPMEAGAELCLFLASAASDGITGKLISAVWDEYREWPNHLSELLAGDLYTLRRIAGRDRGMDWGDK